MRDFLYNIMWTFLLVLVIFIVFVFGIALGAKEYSKQQEPTYDEFKYITDRLEAAVEKLEAMPPEAYILSAEERDLVERVVEAEAGNHSFYGKCAVALCIRNGCEIDDLRPEKCIETFRYAEPRKTASEDVKRAVSAVFDEGFKVTELPILYFYDTAGGFVSKWHETQVYCLSIDSHKYFARAN